MSGSSRRQNRSQPSPFVRSPSSHSSPTLSTPLPQYGRGEVLLLEELEEEEEEEELLEALEELDECEEELELLLVRLH